MFDRRGPLVNVGGGAVTYSGNEVEWDRFLCELVDSDMSVRSPWEKTKRRLVQIHTLLSVESLASQVE